MKLRLVLLVSLLLCCRLAGADPAWYTRLDTWQTTVAAARAAAAEAAAKATSAQGFRPFASDVRRGGMAPLKISVDVTGVDQLWLIATVGGDTYDYDQAIWGEPTVTAADGTSAKLAEIKPESAKVGWGELFTNKNHSGTPLHIGGALFRTGYWAHAPSQLCFKLGGRYTRFEASVGVDQGAGGNGSVVFKVTDKPDLADVAGDDLWAMLARDFTDAESVRQMAWERADGIWTDDLKPGDNAALAQRYIKGAERIKPLAEQARARLAEGVPTVRGLYYRARQIEADLADAKTVDTESLRLAIDDLVNTYGARYAGGTGFQARLKAVDSGLPAAMKEAESGQVAALDRVSALVGDFRSLRREALLANPLLDFEQIMLIRRNQSQMGLPANWQSNSDLPRTGFDNALMTLNYKDAKAAPKLLYQPDGGKFVGDVDLNFDGRRMLFSSIGTGGRWHIFEMNTDATGLRQVTPSDQPDVDNYDACYLPDGRVMYTNTSSFTGVPCVFGSSHVATLFRMNADGTDIRQLGFEQEHDWCPTVLNNGRVLYSRWEYTDTPHSNTRLLFHMNPDGTEQMEYLGSNSYWPNSFFYARPIPGSPTKVVGIISGHHGVPRMGEMIVFDPAKGRQENTSAVQRIPGRGQEVKQVIADQLVNDSWPKFLHPYPLSEKYFLVSCQPKAGAPWGLYLVDTFDNMLLLREESGYAMLEPLPLKATVTPPVVPDKVNLKTREATVYIQNIYSGPGLRGVEPGAVKKLRVFTYEFAYHNMGGLLGVIGLDGPWDIKRIMGTVPVEPDGSAFFKIPANTPITIQPLDDEGRAMQLMRSWMTAMPGETLSCVGCHEKQNSAPLAKAGAAVKRAPNEIAPWYGPTRGFSYAREVQPVIDRYCVGCHDGTKTAADLRGDKNITDWAIIHAGNGGGNGGRFSVGYAELARYVHRPGIESDYHTLSPMDFSAETSELVQLLRKGHYGVQLDAESWDRLYTWIDLNAPYHGTWTDAGHNPGAQRERRRDLLKLYANVEDDPEAEAGGPAAKLTAAALPRLTEAPRVTLASTPATWAFDAAEAQRRQSGSAARTRRVLDLGGGQSIELVLVPAGTYLMGSTSGAADEQPQTPVTISKPFWMGRVEVTNAQFRRFDPTHDSHVEDKLGYQFGIHGYPLDGPQQPVVRVSWNQSVAFCRWLSKLSGNEVSLPTEAQWEWACRAGSAQPFWYGGLDVDFAKLANLGDAKLRELSSDPYTLDTPYATPAKYDDWTPKESRFNDGGLVTVEVGRYQPNAWGLADMHGNAAEWTRTTYRPYPYRAEDGRDDLATAGEKVVRGGSWRDRPFRCTASFRLAYRPYQPAHDVGFRVVMPVTKADEPVQVAQR
ncbi:MAG: SUMF1/EgtB/PvdO family nonheme iron enzyme [Armatimonadetes bacterium]|nr:SUMF1/EgtB/PvdO family nonheme iron enzyme [Armatimonadota bacterium]